MSLFQTRSLSLPLSLLHSIRSLVLTFFRVHVLLLSSIGIVLFTFCLHFKIFILQPVVLLLFYLTVY